MNISCLINNQNDYVYHYTSWENAILNIIPYGFLKFTPLEKTNDPVEFSNYYGMSLSGNKASVDSSLDAALKMLSYRRNIKISCCCRSGGNAKHDIFDAGYFKTRMWSQYGRDSTGVCIAFNKKLLVESVKYQMKGKKVWYGNIKYTNELKIKHAFNYPIEQIPEIFFQRNYRGFFFEKLKDYRDENEFRIAIQDDNPSDHIMVKLLSNSISCVITGMKTPIQARRILDHQCQKKHNCPVYEIAYMNGEYILT